METNKNLFQLSKTLRFGLTLKKKERKEGYTGDIYESHSELMGLVKDSEKRIIDSENKKAKNQYDKLPVDEVRTCFNKMKAYLREWEKTYTRYDQIAVTKDYYRRLERKAKFDGFWKNKEKKLPQAQIIKLSSLKNKYEQKERKDYIIDYWAENIRKTKQKLYDFDLVLKKFEEALLQNRDDNKLNQVEFRKMFLPITKLIKETLEPLYNSSICFPDIEKLTVSDNKSLKDFALENKTELLNQIESLIIYFEENGGYVNYGKATLNKYTALQKPDRTNNEIIEAFEKLGMIKFINKYENAEKLNADIESIKNKKDLIKKDELTLIEKVQLFKYKPIPATVRYSLSEYLYKDKDKEKTKALFNAVGVLKSPGKDYTDLINKGDFDLYKYPLKVAFDYAWESLAKRIYHQDIDFPKEKCEEFLKDVFEMNTKTESFRLYADLLFIRENLATLDHSIPADRQYFIRKVKETLNKINFSYIKVRIDNKNYNAKDLVINWLDLSREEQKNAKKQNKQVFKQYESAKNKIGLIRGGLKNKINVFKELTEVFKKIAPDFGKAFANIRDKLNEENELNKISHYGIIVEDSNNDKYVLLSKLSEERKQEENLFQHEPNGKLKTYRVKSLTSKTLLKFLKNKKGVNKGFHKEEGEWQFPRKKWEELNQDESFLNYVKDRLQNSDMAKNQEWNEFEWNFENCHSYEAIEKEVDRKGYKLKDNLRISEETVKNLVKEKGCLLLPFVNQDITSQNRNKELKPKNQFTKDWEKIFEGGKGYRLHPEFRMSYRQPTPNYPKPEEKRYSRFQMIAHLLCEFIPQSDEYISRKQQIQIFNDKEEQKKQVEKFNNKLDLPEEYYVFGIDRGLKQLATLCVLNHQGQIQGEFKIYTRKFDANKKEWKHTLLNERAILDLSNLRVETTVAGEKVLVDQASVKVRDKNNGTIKDNQQKIKLKQLAYIRKLQYQMQINENKVVKFIEQYTTQETIENNIGELITPYKEGSNYDDLPEEIMDMLTKFNELVTKEDEYSKSELKALCELDVAYDLKRGVVANMIGVIAYLLKVYNYKVYVSLEDLCFAFGFQADGLTEKSLQSTRVDRTVDFKNQENLVLAGLGTYHFFEMQLLKKLFRIQEENDIRHLVPAFRSTDNYEKIVRKKDNYVNYPFGIVHFVNPKNTSKKCPICENTNVYRKRKNDVLVCNNCTFQTDWNESITHELNELLKKHNKQNIKVELIKNGDDNGAYHIALKTLKDLIH